MLVLRNLTGRWIREDEFRTNCPFCSDTKEHLYVSTSKRCFYCFRCGIRGRYETDNSPQQKQTPKHILENFDLRQPSQQHIQYLQTRLRPTEILQFRPMSCPIYPSYVFSLFSRPIVGRAIDDTEPKYRILSKEELRLFGHEYVDFNEPLILVEGIFDLFAVRRSYPNVVALLGKQISKPTFTFLACKRPTQILILLDSDVKEKEVQKLANTISQITDVRIIKLEGGDPWDNRDLNFSQFVRD